MRAIKSFIISIALTLTLITGVSAEFFSDIIVTSTDGIWTDSRAYSSLTDAVNAVGSTKQRTIVISSQLSVGDITIPSNITLKFERDGAIINSGQLTLNTRNIIAENRQIFAGAGDIDFTSGTVLKSGWFSTFERAATLTSDDSVTLIITKPQTVTTTAALGNNVILKWDGPGNILTANAGVDIQNICAIEAGDFQLFAGAGDFDFTNGISLKLSWFARLRSAITYIGTDEVTLNVTRPSTVDLTDTSPSNISLYISKGSPLTISPGVILTIGGQILSIGEYQQFVVASGGIVFSLKQEVNLAWFPDTMAGYQAAITAANRLIVPANKTYSLTSRLVGHSNLDIIFPKDKSTTWEYSYEPVAGDNLETYANDQSMLVFDDGADNVKVENMVAEYTGTTSCGSGDYGVICGVRTGQIDGLEVLNSTFTNFTYSGVRVKHYVASDTVPSTDVKLIGNTATGNAFAGLYVAAVHRGWISGNRTYNNGCATDPLAGYGIELGYSVAGMYNTFNSDITVIDNKSYSNKRKAISVHRGENIKLCYNEVWGDTTDGIGDQIYPIALLGAEGACEISHNVIRTMRGRESAEYTAAYTNQAAISVFAQPNTSTYTPDKTDIKITDNQILDIQDDDEAMYVKGIIVHWNWQHNISYDISRNTIVSGGNIEQFVIVSNSSYTDTSAPDERNQVIFKDNNLICSGKVRSYPVQLMNILDAQISGNYISFVSSDLGSAYERVYDLVVVSGSSLDGHVLIDNEQAHVPTTWTSPYILDTGAAGEYANITNCSINNVPVAQTWIGVGNDDAYKRLMLRVREASPEEVIDRQGSIAFNSAAGVGTASGWQVVYRLSTAIKTEAAAAAVDIDIDTAPTAITAGDIFFTRLDDGSIHWDTIAARVDSDTVTITSGIPAGRKAEVDAPVVILRWCSLPASDASTTAASTGTGTVKTGSAGNADSAGWVEIYPGKWIPYWSDATP